MVKDFDKDVVNAVRALYKDNKIAQLLFDWTAQRERDSASTSLSRISQQLNISRGEAVSLARLLEQANCGQFIVGRRGSKSRFVWSYSCISLGQVASGESGGLEPVEVTAIEIEDDEVGAEAVGTPPTNMSQKITIAEAKRALANSLGIYETNIEIIIKA